MGTSRKNKDGYRKLTEEILKSGIEVIKTAPEYIREEEIEFFIESGNYLLYADLLNIPRFYMQRKVFEIICRDKTGVACS